MIATADATQPDAAPPPSSPSPDTVTLPLTSPADELVWAAVNARFTGDSKTKMKHYVEGLEHFAELGAVAGGILMGLVNLDTGKPEKALGHFRKVLDHSRELPMLYVFIGQTLTELGYYDQALRQFEQAQEIMPDCIGSHSGQGMVHARMGDHETSIELHRKELFKNELLMENVYNMVEARQMQFAHRHGRRAATLAELANQLYLDRLEQGMFHRRAPEDPPSLVSLAYDKCGTHLIADVLQALTGQRSNWAYHEDPDPLERYPEPVPEGEFVAGNWYAHPKFVEHIQASGAQVILQYRDPRDAAVSGYFYCQKPQVLVADSPFAQGVRASDKPSGISFLLERWAPSILHWAVLWMEARVPLYISTFEEIVNRKPQSVARIARFLDVDANEAVIRRVVEATAFKKRSASLETEKLSEDFKRKGKSGDWRNHFNDDMVEYGKLKVGKALIQLGYEQDDNWGVGAAH